MRHTVSIFLLIIRLNVNGNCMFIVGSCEVKFVADLLIFSCRQQKHDFQLKMQRWAFGGGKGKHRGFALRKNPELKISSSGLTASCRHSVDRLWELQIRRERSTTLLRLSRALVARRTWLCWRRLFPDGTSSVLVRICVLCSLCDNSRNTFAVSVFLFTVVVKMEVFKFRKQVSLLKHTLGPLTTIFFLEIYVWYSG